MKMARNYTIRVPKSNKKGGKYFLDKELLKMVDGGNFETRGNTMLAEVKADKLKDVLDRLSELVLSMVTPHWAFLSHWKAGLLRLWRKYRSRLVVR